jgi:enoyl-CoA hydratase/carnithine racemase
VTLDQVLLCSDRDGVRTLTLNRPHRKNAIDAQLWVELADALRATARDDGVRALVITGAGGAFCSGADIGTGEDIHPRHKLRRLTDVAMALHELAVPTVAKVTGVAVGAGWNLALAAIWWWRPQNPSSARSSASAGCRSISADRGCCPSWSGCNRPSDWCCSRT